MEILLEVFNLPTAAIASSDSMKASTEKNFLPLSMIVALNSERIFQVQDGLLPSVLI